MLTDNPQGFQPPEGAMTLSPVGEGPGVQAGLCVPGFCLPLVAACVACTLWKLALYFDSAVQEGEF